MKIIYFGILATLCLIANGQWSANDAWLDAGFATPQVGCDVLGLVYCCFILSNYHKVVDNALVTRAFNLKQQAEAKGLQFDELVKKANKPMIESIKDLDLGIVINNLGFKGLFNMVADGNMNKEEINMALFDTIQNSGLKRENINKLIVERCPNWRYPTDHSGMGMAMNHKDRNGDFADKGVAVRGEDGKPQIDCDALDFFYCCLTSNTVQRFAENSLVNSYKQLKQRAEKNGLSIKDVLTKAQKSFSKNHSATSEMQFYFQDWTNNAELTDQQIAKRLQIQIRGNGSKQDQVEIQKLLQEKCFKNLAGEAGFKNLGEA